MDKISMLVPDFILNVGYDQKVYEAGENKLENECNMFTILETLMKIKASLIVLVGNNNQKQIKI